MVRTRVWWILSDACRLLPRRKKRLMNRGAKQCRNVVTKSRVPAGGSAVWQKGKFDANSTLLRPETVCWKTMRGPRASSPTPRTPLFLRSWLLSFILDVRRSLPRQILDRVLAFSRSERPPFTSFHRDPGHCWSIGGSGADFRN